MTSVMIVEDDEKISSYYESFLTKDKNYSVIGKAFDGKRAIKMYNELNPDVVLLDLGLPEMNGLEVIEHLSREDKEDKKCNIIIVTGDGLLKGNYKQLHKVYTSVSKPAGETEIKRAIDGYVRYTSPRIFPEEKMNDLLLDLNMNIYSNYATRLVSVVKYAYFHPFKLKNINDIYEEIGKDYDSSADSIRSSVRSSIRAIGKTDNKNLLMAVFRLKRCSSVRILTPTYTVQCIITYLRQFE